MYPAIFHIANAIYHITDEVFPEKEFPLSLKFLSAVCDQFLLASTSN